MCSFNALSLVCIFYLEVEVEVVEWALETILLMFCLSEQPDGSGVPGRHHGGSFNYFVPSGIESLL